MNAAGLIFVSAVAAQASAPVSYLRALRPGDATAVFGNSTAGGMPKLTYLPEFGESR
jgi:hypothetical protein